MIRPFLVLFPFMLLACGAPTEQGASLAPATFEGRLSEPGVQLIDARTPGEFAGGHLTDATNLDWNGGQLEATFHELDRTRPVLIYCASGRRSAAARDFLLDQGFKDVVDLQGGINAWAAARKPLEN